MTLKIIFLPFLVGMCSFSYRQGFKEGEMVGQFTTRERYFKNFKKYWPDKVYEDCFITNVHLSGPILIDHSLFTSEGNVVAVTLDKYSILK